MDHYEIQRLRDIIENYADTIAQHASHISICEKCEFAKTEDNLLEIDDGELMYCQPCVDNDDDIDCCVKCGDLFTIKNLEKIDDDLYCDECAYHM